MAEIATSEKISISKQEYLKLKNLEKRFQGFWNYLQDLIDIREARKEIEQGKVISQEELFKELDL